PPFWKSGSRITGKATLTGGAGEGLLPVSAACDHRRRARVISNGAPTRSWHPQIVNAWEVMAKLALKPIEAMSPDEARRQMEETAMSRRAAPLPGARGERAMSPHPA